MLLKLTPVCFLLNGCLLAQMSFLNGNHPVRDSHNCYPYGARWNDRIDRALATGFPVAIEQDLAWYVDPASGQGRVVVTHTPKTKGTEPTLRQYFFEKVRPIVEQAIKDNHPETWPLIVLHFDFKDNQAPLLHAVWQLLGEYEAWISTAEKTSDPHQLTPFTPEPLLVLTEDSDDQEKVFFDEVPIGSRLRLFGSAHTLPVSGKDAEAAAPPEMLLDEKPTTYRRWWNNSWHEVEAGGQPNAGDWTAADNARLHALVDHAHKLGFWIRFYTLDGFTPDENRGWDRGYNFGSQAAVEARWKASIEAGVNLIATDQYEDFATFMRGLH